YEDLTPEPFELTERKDSKGYVRPPLDEMTYVPNKY
ncbi:MAG TPA: polyphosphate kinase 2, partial [Prolixibacteraceae bacterium]|nr:polyphosphate kinase 2 [Prolixibacteraceae bacterium]